MRGEGDPNTEENGAYQRAIPLLYGVAYTLKMKQGRGTRDRRLFRLCCAAARGLRGKSRTRRRSTTARKWTTSTLSHASCVCPTSSPATTFDWAVEAAAKKKLDFSKAASSLAVETRGSVCSMHAHWTLRQRASDRRSHARICGGAGYATDFSEARLHHEIYLSDPRKCAPDEVQTVVRPSR